MRGVFHERWQFYLEPVSVEEAICASQDFNDTNRRADRQFIPGQDFAAARQVG